MSCFYFCFFLLIFVFKVLGSPYGVLLAYGQVRNGLVSHLKQHGGCPDASVHTKGEWQIAPAR